MLQNAKRSLNQSQRYQLKQIKHYINQYAKIGLQSFNIAYDINSIFVENINFLIKRGYDITVIQSSGCSFLTISWRHGKKTNGTCVVIDESQFITKIELDNGSENF